MRRVDLCMTDLMPDSKAAIRGSSACVRASDWDRDHGGESELRVEVEQISVKGREK